MEQIRIAAEADMEAAARYRKLAGQTVNVWFRKAYLKRANEAEAIGKAKLAKLQESK